MENNINNKRSTPTTYGEYKRTRRYEIRRKQLKYQEDEQQQRVNNVEEHQVNTSNCSQQMDETVEHLDIDNIYVNPNKPVERNEENESISDDGNDCDNNEDCQDWFQHEDVRFQNDYNEYMRERAETHRDGDDDIILLNNEGTHQNVLDENIEELEDDHDQQEENDEYEGDHLLYEDARITLDESLLAILIFYLKYHLSGEALIDLLILIEKHCKTPNLCKRSLYLFKQYFRNFHTRSKRHFYCSSCLHPLKTNDSVCPNCPSDIKGTSYFIELSLEDQLKTLYNREEFYDLLQLRFVRRKKNVNNYEDIYDGNVYQEYSRPGRPLALSPDNISFMWNSDGVSIFSSSNYQIWPFILSINELPFNERLKKENLLIGGLWIGPEKPLPPFFLRGISTQLNQIKNGITLNPDWLNEDEVLNVQGHVICGTCDLPAKAIFLNMQQFNGEWGCCKCELQIYRKDKIPIYKYQKELNLRSQDDTNRYAEEAQRIRRERVSKGQTLQPHECQVKGVKGPSSIAKFQPHYIRTTAIDVMHCVYLGVVKSLLHLWFSSKHSREKWSFSRSLTLVDRLLREMTPPDSTTRLPRTISEHFKFWKAHEFKTWFFYYSLPILERVMTADNRQEYFIHYQFLVNAMILLNQDSISDEMIDRADQMLHIFVEQFSNLYDEKFMTANLHQLLHLATNTRDFGPVFLTSCFGFENINGELSSLVTGTRFSGLQIATGLSFFLAIPRLMDNIGQDSIVFNFCNRLSKSKKKYKSYRLSHDIYAIGAVSKKNDLLDSIRNTLRILNISGSNVTLFFRLMKSAILYKSTLYSRQGRTNSSYAKFIFNNETSFGKIQCFIQVSDCACLSYCANECHAQYFAIIKKCVVSSQFNEQGINSSLIYQCTLTEDVIAIEIKYLVCVCFYIKITPENIEYLIEPINLSEAE